jgi:hypothetical protein
MVVTAVFNLMESWPMEQFQTWQFSQSGMAWAQSLVWVRAAPPLAEKVLGIRAGYR